MKLSDVMEKNPATPGIDPGTFRLVVQCLDHYATPGPGDNRNPRFIFKNIFPKIVPLMR
jgi:hypothetical protein